MKNILLVSLFLFIVGCVPVKYVDIRRPYTYRHRVNVYTAPIWIPNRGIMLENKIYIPNKRQQRTGRKH